MDIAVSIVVTLLLTLVNGFFSMSEMALVNVKRPLLERDMEEGDKKAATAFELSGDSGDLLAAIQVAITLVQIVLNNSLVHYGALSPYGKEIPLAAAGIVMGGNVRVGFEDNLYLGRGVLAKSNGELVKKVADMAALLGRPVATPAEARAILGLNP